MKKFLVEITLKLWMPNFPDGTNLCGMVEVDAIDEYFARIKGYDVFMQQLSTNKKFQKRFSEHESRLEASSICASAAIEI